MSNGTLAAGDPVRVISAEGDIFSQYCLQHVLNVGLGFTNAYPYGLNFTKTPGVGGLFAGQDFGRATYSNSPLENLSNNHLVPTFTQPFEFPVSGEYTPVLEIDFSNTTKPFNETVFPLSGVKVPVASAIDLQNAKNARIQTALTDVVVVFVFVEGLAIVLEHTKEEDQSAKAAPAVPTTTPETNSPIPEDTDP